MRQTGDLPLRVGVGFDMHRFVTGRPLILGGVQIPFERGLEGDSDADALTHAILDALLGAAGAGDIGSHFGVGRPEMQGISSLLLLARAAAIVAAKGFRPGNVDATVVAEAPRLGPYIPSMRKALARVLELAEDRVNLKGTTAKGMGVLGAGEGIAAIAVASLIPARVGRPGVPSHRRKGIPHPR
ncbi:MAG TPA: 2-C-methyl-D-erythritol 2,4-cyclodiphosphate synthase [Candidatus Methylomirabilis sp.]|nr:2-C-methyl-D-erythritol 2,4-cyclodiphosphate synthase [Candidatus Methylomirabilis sp.]